MNCVKNANLSSHFYIDLVDGEYSSLDVMSMQSSRVPRLGSPGASRSHTFGEYAE